MSTATSSKPVTQSQRIASAAEQIGTALGLDNHKLLGAILAEAAAQEARRNAAFAEHIREMYLAEAKPTRQARSARQPKQPKLPKPELRPIKRVESHEINIAAALDPYYLYEVYGADQLPLALDEFTVTKLKEAVEAVQKRHPGTKPTNSRNKPAVIDYIVRYVVKGR
jgi:hypothetical protein